MHFRTPAEFCGAKVAKKSGIPKQLHQFSCFIPLWQRFPGYLCPVKDWGSFPNPLCHPQAHTHSLRITAFPEAIDFPASSPCGNAFPATFAR